MLFCQTTTTKTKTTTTGGQVCSIEVAARVTTERGVAGRAVDGSSALHFALTYLVT